MLCLEKKKKKKKVITNVDNLKVILNKQEHTSLPLDCIYIYIYLKISSSFRDRKYWKGFEWNWWFWVLQIGWSQHFWVSGVRGWGFSGTQWDGCAGFNLSTIWATASTVYCTSIANLFPIPLFLNYKWRLRLT